MDDETTDGRPPGPTRSRRLLIGLSGVALAGALSAGGAVLAAGAAPARAAALPPGPGLGGVVTAVGSSSITLTTPDGDSVTVTTNGSTTYREGRQAASASAVTVGDDVRIRPTKSSTATSPVAAEVDVVGPYLAGRVTSVTSSTIQLTDRQGFLRTVHVDASTTYTEASSTVTSGAVTAGTSIVAAGKVDANRTDLDASSVEVLLPRIVGNVTAVSGSTLTLRTPAGASATVTTNASTEFRSGNASSSLSAVKVGSTALALGTKQPDGSLAAVEVDLLPSGRPARGAGPGPGGFGPGAFGPGGPGGPGGLGRGLGG